MKQPLQLLQLILLLLARTAFAMAADNAPQANTSGGITEISVERTWCNGSCPIDTLVLHADGKAEFTGKENTRLTGQFTGMFPKGNFDQLAQWLVAEGFFELGGSYGSPNGDLPTEVIRVTRGERKSVINNVRDKSLQLWGMGNLIRTIAADIQWQPVGSGIRGQSSAGLIFVEPEKQGFTPSGTREAYAVSTGREGRYEVPLPAGTYRISSVSDIRNQQTVVVEPNRFTEVNLRFDAVPSNVPKNNASPPAGALPPPPGDGLYIHNLRSKAKWEYRKGDRYYLLADKTEPVILTKQLESDSVDNSTFKLALTIPYDEKIAASECILIVDGIAYDQVGSGSRGREVSFLDFQIPSEESAREVTRYFGIAIGRFSKPDYKLSVSLAPTQQSFKRGEAVTARLEIVNTGTAAAEFRDSSFSRVFGTNRNDYTFTALRNGQPVPDISFPGERGGRAIPNIIQPGKIFEDTVNLGKWFEFKEPGSYTIHGIYKLNFQDSRTEAHIKNRNIQLPLVRWTEDAEVDFVVLIE